MAKILLEMRNITKTFPGVKALSNVNLKVEEGVFDKGQWIPGRRLNGDETALLSLERPEILHVKFFTY